MGHHWAIYRCIAPLYGPFWAPFQDPKKGVPKQLFGTLLRGLSTYGHIRRVKGEYQPRASYGTTPPAGLPDTPNTLFWDPQNSCFGGPKQLF
jgi:hypothetical protein